MNNAVTMFNKLGFKFHNSGDDFLLYMFETDYDKIFVRFDFKEKTYCATRSRFIDNNEQAYVPMNKRPQNIKHSAYYGYWQEMYHEIDIELHNAIHQQMIELGWIE